MCALRTLPPNPSNLYITRTLPPHNNIAYSPPLPCSPSFSLRIVLNSYMASADVEYRCFVGGLAWATDDHSLGQAFSAYGEILESKVRLTRR